MIITEQGSYVGGALGVTQSWVGRRHGLVDVIGQICQSGFLQSEDADVRDAAGDPVERAILIIGVTAGAERGEFHQTLGFIAHGFGCTGGRRGRTR